MTTRTTYESYLRQARYTDTKGGTEYPSGEQGYQGIFGSVTSGGPVPNYRQRIANGEQATTPLDASGTKLTLVNSDIALSYYEFPGGAFDNYRRVRGNLSWVPNTPPDPSLVFIQSVQNQTKMNIVAKIRQAQTSLQGLVSAGEIGETVRLVNGAGRGLFRGVSNYLSDVSYLTKGKRITPQGLVRAVGEKWLEYAFGWRPLIADIDQGMTAFDRWKNRRSLSVKVRAQSQSLEKIPASAYEITYARHAFRVMPMMTSTYGYRIYGQVRVNSQAGLGSLAHEFGFKPDEVIPTLWELIPFSFLSDYFINIGAVISAMALNTSAIGWLNYGEYRESSVEGLVSYSHIPLAAPWIKKDVTVSLGTPFKHVRYLKSRNGLPGFSYLVPSLQFSIPGSSTRWINMAALATQLTDTTNRVRRYRL
jgi:hypothetical protein